MRRSNHSLTNVPNGGRWGGFEALYFYLGDSDAVDPSQVHLTIESGSGTDIHEVARVSHRFHLESAQAVRDVLIDRCGGVADGGVRIVLGGKGGEQSLEAGRGAVMEAIFSL